MILAAAAAVSSCETASSEFAPLASSVKVDKADIALPNSGASGKVTVTSDGDWICVAPSWVTVNPKSGRTGSVEVSFVATDNVNEWKEQNGPRKGIIYFFGDGKEAGTAMVNLLQAGEPGLDSERTYKKITSAEELEAGKSYLIVFDSDGKGALKACTPVSLAPDSGSYSYMFTDDVEESEEGTIITPNESKGFTFVAKGSGYAIQQSDANYLYQSSTYANFYTTASLDKGDVWKAEFLEDGTVKLTNRTNGGAESDENDKVLHWSPDYKNVEARSGAAAPYPYLYKDSAAPTDEILMVDDLTVVASAVSATIPVTSNKTWKVRNHDEWIKSFKKSDDGKAIEITFDANTSLEAARTATFTVIGETTNKVVTLTQNKVATTVAEIAGQLTSTDSKNPSPYEATLAGATVSYVNGSNVYIQDESGAILLYLKESGLAAGDVIKGKVSGTGYLYNALPEITALGTEFTKETGTAPAPKEITLADLLKNYNANLSRLIVLKGVTVTKEVDGSDNAKRSGEISQGTGDAAKTIVVRDQTKKVVMAEGAVGDLVCFPAIFSTTKQLAVYETSQFTPAE